MRRAVRHPTVHPRVSRNRAQPLSLWTWSKVVRRIARAAGVPRFSTHTTRHLCLTDLARMGWDLHAIAVFAGHRHTDSTLAYINLSGRDLAGKLGRGMDHIHAWRIAMLTGTDAATPGRRGDRAPAGHCQPGRQVPLALTGCRAPLR